ncbi:hypothetical protein Q6281_28695, partial [Klebsiella pneumoniae]
DLVVTLIGTPDQAARTQGAKIPDRLVAARQGNIQMWQGAVHAKALAQVLEVLLQGLLAPKEVHGHLTHVIDQKVGLGCEVQLAAQV